MNIFSTLPQGDSATWTDTAVLLPDGRTATAPGWTLTYALRGPTALDIVAVAAGAAWTATLTPLASAALAAGAYVWSAVLTTGTERITCGQGQFALTPNLATVSGPYDGRTVAQVALANCEASMATFNATGGKVRKYEIAGRTMEFQSIADLMRLHAFWTARVLTEKTASSVANGLGNPRNLVTRFRSVG